MVINNSKYYNDSLAYDFELFMPKPKKQPAEVVKMPQKKIKKAQAKTKAKARRQVSGVVTLVLLAAFMVGIVCVNIAIRVEITEVNSDIVEAKNRYAAISGEETRLDVEFERMVSYDNLEETAKQLGMKKTDKNQIVYITVNDSDKAVDKEGNVLTAENE